MADFISCYRASTDRQGAISLGLEVQRETVQRYMGERVQLIAEYTEIESAK